MIKNLGFNDLGQSKGQEKIDQMVKFYFILRDQESSVNKNK